MSIVHKVHVSDGSEGLEFILSNATIDRYGDSIVADGWDLRNFSKNPIALFNHNSDFPIGKWERLGVKDGALRGHLKMAPKGTSARIDELHSLISAGILRSVSVGFMPIESEMMDKGGRKYLKCELVETSLVSVPANPDAVMTAKSLKISNDILRMVFAKHDNETILRSTWLGQELPQEKIRTTTWMGMKVPARNF